MPGEVANACFEDFFLNSKKSKTDIIMKIPTDDRWQEIIL